MSRPEESGRDAWLGKPLAGVTRWVLAYPRVVLVAAALLTVSSVVLTVNTLGFRSSRLDLLNPASPFNRRWIAYLDEFGDQDDIVVVVKGASAASVVPALRELASAFERDDAYSAVLVRRDLSRLREKALHYLTPDQLVGVGQVTDRSQPILARDWYRLSALGIVQGVFRQVGSSAPGRLDPRERGGSRETRQWLRAYIEGLFEALQGDPPEDSAWTPLARQLEQLQDKFSSDYLLQDQGRLGMILLRLGDPRQRPERLEAEVQRLRKRVAEIEAAHPATRIGVTGMPILEVDEMQASQRDSLFASLLSLLGVACVFRFGFGGLLRPLIAVAVLGVALAWCLAFTSLVVGHLNILSAAFGVILIGLGVDFSIHYLSHYGELQLQTPDSRTALIRTARVVGPGIVTGGITTSLAFSTAGLTEFTGVAELGIIVSGGILLCVVATMIVLPPLLSCWGRTTRAGRPGGELARWLQVDRWQVGRGFVLLLIGVAIVAAGGRWLKYDHNLLHLQPAGLESVAWERELTRRLDRGVWYGVSFSDDREELLARKEKIEQLPLVSGTEEIVSLVPQPSRSREAVIARIQQQLTDLPNEVPALPLADREQLAAALERLPQEWIPFSLGGDGVSSGGDWIRQLSPDDYSRRLAEYQHRVARDWLAVLWALRAMAAPAGPSLQDLPAALRTRFVGRNGEFLLRVYGDERIWDMHPLEQFVAQLESVDPQITGHPIQTFYASRQMQRSFLNAALYALIAVAIVLMLDFQKIRHCLLAMVPMLVGVVGMFGVLGWSGIALNPANLIVLPLILGIGIDDGVHVVHDFRQQRGRPYQMSVVTANAILLTSATTMVGFGSLMLATHRGLRSLGQVLTIGIFCCLIASLYVLPPLLRRWQGAFS